MTITGPSGSPDAMEIENAEAEYLSARVAALLSLEGNPHRAGIQRSGPLEGLLVQATASPMVNRICGDARAAPEALGDLLDWFSAHQCSAAIPLTFLSRRPGAVETVGRHELRRVNGWTHAQLASSIEGVLRVSCTIDVEEITADTFDSFADIHASAFNTRQAERLISRASFAGLLSGGRARGFLARVHGKAVAGAIVYFAKDGVAYLGTAATLRETRGNGCHNALIGRRIIAAREYGSRFIAATCLPNSQSRRNLERFGLTESHTQTLYRAS